MKKDNAKVIGSAVVSVGRGLVYTMTNTMRAKTAKFYIYSRFFLKSTSDISIIFCRNLVDTALHYIVPFMFLYGDFSSATNLHVSDTHIQMYVLSYLYQECLKRSMLLIFSIVLTNR